MNQISEVPCELALGSCCVVDHLELCSDIDELRENPFLGIVGQALAMGLRSRQSAPSANSSLARARHLRRRRVGDGAAGQGVSFVFFQQGIPSKRSLGHNF